MREPALNMNASSTVVDTGTCGRCGAFLPRRSRLDAWLEVPLDGGWIAAYRIVVAGGRPVVAEVRLFPDEERRTAGSWSEESASVPLGGIPGSTLRALRLADPIRYFPQIIANFERRHGAAAVDQVFGRYGISRTDRISPRRPGRAGRPDEFYLRWAVAYTERVAARSPHPIADLAAEPPVAIEGYLSSGGRVPEATVHDILFRARKRELLSDSPSGRAGGELTAKAMKELERLRSAGDTGLSG